MDLMNTREFQPPHGIHEMTVGKIQSVLLDRLQTACRQLPASNIDIPESKKEPSIPAILTPNEKEKYKKILENILAKRPDQEYRINTTLKTMDYLTQQNTSSDSDNPTSPNDYSESPFYKLLQNIEGKINTSVYKVLKPKENQTSEDVVVVPMPYPFNTFEQAVAEYVMKKTALRLSKDNGEMVFHFTETDGLKHDVKNLGSKIDKWPTIVLTSHKHLDVIEGDKIEYLKNAAEGNTNQISGPLDAAINGTLEFPPEQEGELNSPDISTA